MSRPARAAITTCPSDTTADTLTATRHGFLLRFFWLMFACAACLVTTGCAGTLPGGTETVNEQFLDEGQNLKEWVDSLEPGMTKGETFARLGRLERDFLRLNRSEIIGVIFGGEDAGIPLHFRTDEDILAFLESIEGYRMNYRRVKRKHGIASPIRLQTDEKGFDYSLSLVFKDGRLYQKPFLSGGLVNDVETQTIFDYLNPGSLFDRAIDN